MKYCVYINPILHENGDPMSLSMKLKELVQARNKFAERVAVVRLTIKDRQTGQC